MRPTARRFQIRPTTPQRLRWTVSERRRREAARKAERRRDDHDDLITRLKILFDLRTPESWRETLAADMPSLTARCTSWEAPRWMPFRAVDWIVDTFWAQLPVEKNPKVRCSLLRLGTRMLSRPPFTYNERTRDERAMITLLDVMDLDLSVEERERTLLLLAEILDWNGADENGPRIAHMALRLIAEHRTGSPYSAITMRRLAKCLRHAVQDVLGFSAVEAIVDDEHALAWIFDGLAFADGKLHRCLSSLLAAVLDMAEDEERTTLVVRHYTRLQLAFHMMRLRDGVEFLHHPEFAGIFATTPSLLRLLHSHTAHDCARHDDDCWAKFPYDDYCQIATYMLENAIDDRCRLQHLLGYGFLTMAAGHFARGRFDMNPRRPATYSQILALHPEWKQRFRERTADGCVPNLTADLGRSIRERPPSRPYTYIFEEEDD